ncbi:MAG: hypothetical protein JSU57_00325 [Candidatus Heimdallarchaeota archaeon]|nr:MAG: hypothetical protein JSU57_00325 [Candidatus Heimdallarchaeota archaeon]
MQFRTFGWIARQNAHIRMTKDKIEDNKKFTFPELSDKKIQVAVTDRKVWFKKGELWPTIILVEKGWDKTGTIKKEDAYIRIFRHEDGAILDILVGESLDDGTLLAVDYKVPLFSVTCSRKGTRGTVQRIHLDII